MNTRVLVPFFALWSAVYAADLKTDTIQAWERYVQSADASMQARLRPAKTFLWIDQAAGRRKQLRAGDILVTPMGEHTPFKVPNGLIHHWLGAAFIPHAHLDNVFGIVRDYAHYKDYYNPTVIDSRIIAQAAGADRFSMLLLNKSLFLKTALESEYTSSYVQVSDGRWYSISTADRVQEVEDYGQSSERELPPGEGDGYIWRLHSISRYEEADGGVYVEVEAMALSRDIPGAVRWIVDPIVRRVSRGAIVTSLRQTMDAVEASGQTVARRTTPSPRLASGFLKSPDR